MNSKGFSLTSKTIIMISDFISTADINESYIFQQTLGLSEFNEVKKALYKADSTPVAIKIIDKKKISSRDLSTYIHKCQLLFFLQHPNIIQIYELFDNPNYFYIVMEYCSGGQLYEQHNLHRFQNQSQITKIVMAITDALDYCHSKYLVHTNIRPQNILWTSNDENAVLKIIGFVKLSALKRMVRECGISMFVSPEMLEGKPYDGGVDFWSLGVITYVLLSGKPPFDGENERQLYEKIKVGKIQFPERQWKYISCSAKDFILRLLENSPKKRYKADKIRQHPWIISDHQEDLIYRKKKQNIKYFQADRKVEKIKQMIKKTWFEINNEQQKEQINMSMIEQDEDRL